MGNQQCQQCKQVSPENQAYGTYQISKRSHNFNNSSCQFGRNMNKIYAVVQKKVQKDPILQQKVLEQLQTRKQVIKNAHLVTLHSYTVTDTQYGFCVNMYYEYIPTTLRNRIQQLKLKGQQFSERELFAILYGIQQALELLYSNAIKHCCINLDTILCKNNLLYKLTDVSSTTYITSYDLVSKGDCQQFLSQKLLDNFQHKSLAPQYELTDDLFSLGMIVLMAAAGKSVSDFYLRDKKGNCYLKIANINLSFKLVQRNYSSKLIKKIKSFLFFHQCNNSTQNSLDLLTHKHNISDQTNISDSLQELQQQMSRVLGRVKMANSPRKKSQKSYNKYQA